MNEKEKNDFVQEIEKHPDIGKGKLPQIIFNMNSASINSKLMNAKHNDMTYSQIKLPLVL